MPAGANSKPSSRPKAPRDRSRDFRARMRAKGLRPIQIWVPDVRSPEFLAEARRQSLAVAGSGDTDDQDFIDAVSIQLDDE